MHLFDYLDSGNGYKARLLLAQIGQPYEWTEVDITQDDRLFTEYGEQIPVTFVDGKQHDFWRVDPVRLRKALAG